MRNNSAAADESWKRATADLYNIGTMASEIIEFSGRPEAEVWRRLALELESTGFNVIEETRRFGVTPYVFDDRMVEFYTKSDGFIFESLVESRSPFRVTKWRQIVDFIGADSVDGNPSILIYGDSVGSDSICLKSLGYDVTYHDFDSYCAKFARFRFDKRGLQISKLSDTPGRKFDYLICLEVAEHVPNPPRFVEELKGHLKDPEGVCLFSESFALLRPQFPTHLSSNVEFAGKNDELFAAVGMTRLWKDPNEKPYAYVLHPGRKHFDPFPVAAPPTIISRAKGRIIRAFS